jgi:hypothetical protein
MFSGKLFIYSCQAIQNMVVQTKIKGTMQHFTYSRPIYWYLIEMSALHNDTTVI